MCTLVILRRPGHDWPLLAAGNRDEMRGRASRPPARHWEDRPEVVAGLDEVAGGTWLGLNDHGLLAVVMNREGSLGPAPDKRSRGELVLEALDHAEAGAAAGALADLDPDAYRPFNLFVGDPVGAYWLRHADDGEVRVAQVPPGLHLLASRELDDRSQPRIRTYLPRFRVAATPDPQAGDWRAWQTLLASRARAADAGPEAAMNLDLPGGFGTLSSHLVALPRYPGHGPEPVFLYADGPPDRVAFDPVDLSTR